MQSPTPASQNKLPSIRRGRYDSGPKMHSKWPAGRKHKPLVWSYGGANGPAVVGPLAWSEYSLEHYILGTALRRENASSVIAQQGKFSKLCNKSIDESTDGKWMFSSKEVRFQEVVTSIFGKAGV